MSTGVTMIQRFDWRGFAFPFALVVVTEAIGQTIGIDSDAFARPSAIAMAAAQALLDGELLKATAQTLTSTLGGMAIGATLGLVLGALLGLSPVIYRLLEVTLEAIRPIPSVALIPVVLLIFGLGFLMEISLVAKSAMWPMFLLTYAAVRGVKPRLIEISRLLGLSLFDRLRKIVLPAALPGIFVGLRLSAAAALIVAVTVEIAANPLGIGYAIMQAEERLRPDLTFAYVIWLGVIGWLIKFILLQIQNLFRIPAEAAAK